MAAFCIFDLGSDDLLVLLEFTTSSSLDNLVASPVVDNRKRKNPRRRLSFTCIHSISYLLSDALSVAYPSWPG